MLLPGTIYLVGPDRDVEIVDESATVFAVARKGPKPSIDRLFATAAQSHGDRLVAVIFSGMGSDGLAGARVVKEHGGTVVVQDPATASFPSMPLAIPPTLIDLTGRAEAIGGMLVALLDAERRPLESGPLQVLLRQLRDRSGIDFARYKMPTIMRRLSRLMVAARVESLAEYLRYFGAHPEEHQRLVAAFLIKVTEFFRDPALFEELRTIVLPALIAHARANGNELRIWSAGTSTGEEAYSLAILCAELLHDDAITVRIFATDLDDEAIAFARRGVYGAESVRHIPPALLERYFTQTGDVFEVIKRVRAMTVFGRHDLGARAPFPRIDLCVCRNVLIYFTKELQARAVQLFTFALRDGGFLVVGKAESPGPLAEYFRVVDGTQKIYQRQGDRIVIPPARLGDPSVIFDGRGDHRTGTAASLRRGADRPGAAATFGAFLAASTIGIIVVDRRYDIAALNAAARTLLEIHGVAIGEDLIHLVRTVDAEALRALADAAFAGEAPEPREFALSDPSGSPSDAWLHISAVRDPADGRGETVAIMLVDISASVGRRRTLEDATTQQSARLHESAGKIDELSRRVRSLLQANDELTRANTGLRSTNDQLLIHAEEAASANEEIETLNEEMQATNEELETLNEELQATVEELNATNEELTATNGDLGSRGERLDGQRSMLGAALEAVGGPVAIVEPDGRVLYASTALGERTVFDGLAAGWWRTPAVRLNGATYEPRVVPLDGAPFVIALLRRLP